MSLLRTCAHSWIACALLACGCVIQTTVDPGPSPRRVECLSREHLQPPPPPTDHSWARFDACECETVPEVPSAQILAALPEAPPGPVRAKLAIILDSYFVKDAIIRHSATPPLTPQEVLEHYVSRIEAEVYPIFARDFDLRFETGFTLAFPESDPFGEPVSTTTNGEPWFNYLEMITDLANWRSQGIPNNSEIDCVIMLTMKNYAVAGVAVGSACTVVQGQAWDRNAGIAWNYNVAVIAHEMAHQFRVGHDIDNEYFPHKYVMNTYRSIEVLREFSPRSKEHWQLFLRTQGTCLEPVEAPPPVVFLRGDANGDGRVQGTTDALLITNYLFAGGRKPPCMDAADVNDDGRVNLPDAVRLLNYQFSGGASPNPPFPEPGFDPTLDELGCDD